MLAFFYQHHGSVMGTKIAPLQLNSSEWVLYEVIVQRRAGCQSAAIQQMLGIDEVEFFVLFPCLMTG